MARERSPLRKKALRIWLKSRKTKKLVDVADELGVSAVLIRKWKLQDKWDEEPLKRPRGAPAGNQNAVGNSGGPGASEGNHYAYKNGFYTDYLPDEVKNIVLELEDMDPLDIQFNNIMILQAKLLHGQKITHVRDRDDITKELKKKGKAGTEWEIQQSWDKHNADIKTQAAVMSQLQTMIRNYTNAVNDYGTEEQRLKVEKLSAEVKALGVMTERMVVFNGESNLKD
jgi:uncharacterized protein YjcR